MEKSLIITREDGAVTLTDEAKKFFLNAWQEKEGKY